MQLPGVKKCDMLECYYNREKKCHAGAINVGGSHPQCDTFTISPQHIPLEEQAQVGACKVTNCKYNQDMSCHASGIDVSHHDQHADCCTFEQR